MRPAGRSIWTASAGVRMKVTGGIVPTMKKTIASILVFLLILCMVPAMAEAAAIDTRVVEINKYGQVRLDITETELEKAGVVLGDIVTVTCGDYTGDMPCFNGYYVDREATLVYINPFVGSITLGVNYGSFVNLSGVGKGDAVTIAMKEKGGVLDIQEVNNLVYSDERADFASDEVFANFRPVVEGKLYRSVSPVDNRIKRARTADNLIREAGVQTVMNMVNTDEEIVELMAADDYDSPYYRELYEAGKVIALEMSIDYTVKAFVEGLVEGFTFLSEGETPFLVHCLEGKDRTGFAIMTLEALMGWSEEQIVADYMKTYSNFYGIEPGTDRYDLIMEKNIEEMLRYMEALQTDTSTSETDLKTAAEAFLRENGMAEEALKRLEAKLASE
jgi:protein tyrosine/serine phosphatase